MGSLLLVAGLMSIPLDTAVAQVSLQIGLPAVQLGVHQPEYPQMVRVPGYPVYYAPGGNSNYFFYDGMYWVLKDDSWYTSSWYNGPWAQVAPRGVPDFILRVPVRYYRQPPAYFQGWRADAAPRWGDRWGQEWQQQRRGWNRWDRQSAPRPAPLPAYQERYSGDRYPQWNHQQALQATEYRYHPRDQRVRQAYQEQRNQGGPQMQSRGPDRDENGRPNDNGRRNDDDRRDGRDRRDN